MRVFNNTTFINLLKAMKLNISLAYYLLPSRRAIMRVLNAGRKVLRERFNMNGRSLQGQGRRPYTHSHNSSPHRHVHRIKNNAPRKKTKHQKTKCSTHTKHRVRAADRATYAQKLPRGLHDFIITLMYIQHRVCAREREIVCIPICSQHQSWNDKAESARFGLNLGLSRAFERAN
jgi:hypothetical protein